ncbi:MAG TPA: M3 family metallopeptidase [Polyangiaceae bacterium]|jgi:oligoendopeptidase F
MHLPSIAKTLLRAVVPIAAALPSCGSPSKVPASSPREPSAAAPAPAARTAAAETPAPFEPIPAAIANDYRVRFDHFFASPAVEADERAKLTKDVRSYVATKLPKGAAGVEAYLVRGETLLTAVRKHRDYAHLRSSIDTTDAASKAANEELDNLADELWVSVWQQLGGLAKGDALAMTSARPTLRRWSFLFEGAAAKAAHTPPADQAKLIGDLATPVLDGLAGLYFTTESSTPFSKVATARGPLDVSHDARELATNRDPAVRQEAFAKRTADYTSRRDIYAALLVQIVHERQKLAVLSGYPDAPSEAYASRMQLERKDVSKCLADVATSADTNKGFQEVERSHLRATTGLAQVHSWDLHAPTAGFEAPRFDLPRAREVTQNAVAVLGPEYAEHCRALIDPARGRLDVRDVAKGRYSGGYSAAGDEAVLYVGKYTGYLADVDTFIHEGGHALQRQFEMDAGVSPFFTTGNNWIPEGIAIFNELLLEHSLEAASNDPKERAYYESQFIQQIAFQIFGSATEGALEEAIYDGVSAGKISTADDLDALSLRSLGRYSIWPAIDPELKSFWITRSLMFEDPVYLVNYLYAGLLATKLFTLQQADPEGFRPKYLAFLRGGLAGTPAELIRHTFGFEFSCATTLADDLSLMREKTAKLKADYAAIDAPRP